MIYNLKIKYVMIFIYFFVCLGYAAVYPTKEVFEGVGEGGICPPMVSIFFEYNTLIYLKNVMYKQLRI
jgi:hypothetical protein